MKTQHTPTYRQDSNWIVKAATLSKRKLIALRIKGITDVEQKTLIKIEVMKMNDKEVCAALKKEAA